MPKKVTHTPQQTAKWIRSIMQVLVLDFLQAQGRKWDPEDKRILRTAISRAHIEVAKGAAMEGCDAWVEHGKTPNLKFAESPTCSWIQVIAHELAHIIDWVRTGEGVSHGPGFFRVYRRLLNLWFQSTETVQFVAIEHVICDPDDVDDEPNGPFKQDGDGTLE
jgi:hypothetical protein